MVFQRVVGSFRDPDPRGRGRMMIFIDGENLTMRYQAVLAAGGVPRPEIFHVPDVAVWHAKFSQLTLGFTVLRATYYTSAQGDESKLVEIRRRLKAQTFYAIGNASRFIHPTDTLPQNLTPCVLKRRATARSSKGVDINITVDVLSHVYKGNVEAVYLMTGDGDFLPLVEEVLRQGKQVYLSAFSDGLNPKLPEVVDAFHCLDTAAFLPSSPAEEHRRTSSVALSLKPEASSPSQGNAEE